MRRLDSLDLLERSLARVHRVGMSTSAFRARSRRAGTSLSAPAVAVLGVLERHGPQRVADVAARTNLVATLVSREVRSLVGDGLVRRDPHPDDGRAVVLSLTEDGRDAYRRQRDAVLAITGEALGGWSAAELAHLARQVARLADDLAAWPGSPTGTDG